MSARLRKLIGLFGVLLFLFVYVGLAVAIADRLPNIWWLQIIYFAIVGIAWGVPLLPFFRWMNQGK